MCVDTEPDILDKVESEVGSLAGTLSGADFIGPRAHQKIRNLIYWDLPKMVKEHKKLRREVARLQGIGVEYEYALQMDSSGDERPPFTLAQYFPDRYATDEYWGEKEERQRYLEWLIETFENSKFWMVKRRKAGKVERL